MKTLPLLMKYVVIPVSSAVGMLYGFDTYIVKRAETTVEPTKAKVELMVKDVEEIKIRTRNIENILMQRTPKGGE